MIEKLNKLISLVRHTKYTSFPDDENEIELTIATLVEEIMAEINTLEKRVAKLDALEQFGVDNWSGYSAAMEHINNPE